jgi:hypothetical protein
MLVLLYSIPSTFYPEHCLILIAATGFENVMEAKIGKGSSRRNSSAVDQGPAIPLSDARHSLLLPRAPSTARYTRSYPFGEEMDSQRHYA